jgi:hypothetical protein
MNRSKFCKSCDSWACDWYLADVRTYDASIICRSCIDEKIADDDRLAAEVVARGIGRETEEPWAKYAPVEPLDVGETC